MTQAPGAQRRVLIMGRDLPRPNWDGTSAYLLALIEHLSQAGFSVEFVLLNPSRRGLALWQCVPRELAQMATVRAREMWSLGRVLVRPLRSWPPVIFWSAVLALPLSWRRALRRGLHLVRAPRPTYESPADRKRWSPLADWREQDYARAQFAPHEPGVVMVVYAYLGPVLEGWTDAPEVLRAILTIDILHRRVLDLARYGLTDGHENCTIETEGAELRKADLLIAIQSEEAQELRKIAPAQEVIAVPLSRAPRPSAGRQHAGRCLVVSSRANNNVHGLRWFLDRVWPRVRAEVPQASLHICGTIASAFKDRYPGVTFQGRRDDLEPEYAAAEAYIVPVLAGSGLKIKLVEALAHGRACVAAPAGARGLDGLIGAGVLVGEGDAAFAIHVITLLTQPAERRRHEDAAVQYVREYLSPERVYAPLVERLERHFAAHSVSPAAVP